MTTTTESLALRGINADGDDIASLQFKLTQLQAYAAGQLSYDPASKSIIADTGYSEVRVNVGFEQLAHVFNDTGALINNGDPLSYTLGVDVTTGLPKVSPTSSSAAESVLAFAGVATMNIPDGEAGVVTIHGLVKGVDTSTLSAGFIYADAAGGYVQTRPRYPEHRLIIGGVVKVGETDGIIFVESQTLRRRSAGRTYTFTSADAAAGEHYRAGFYDWASADVTLTQSSTTQTHGPANLTRAAHIGVVASAAGTVDTGQVGLQVTGTLDSETGVQTASQTKIITDDITTLTTDMMVETLEKFSGQVTISTYTVSGSPAAWSVTFNYGYSKYEDILNQDGTVVGFEAVWEAGASDAIFNIELLHHRASGWTYAATGFEPGNGAICERLVDQAIESSLASGEDGAYKRVGLNTFIEASEKEGAIIRITTGSNLSIRSMDLHVSVFSEELD